jgi:hypothetical protein
VSFGEETKIWYSLLKPVLAGFVKSFEDPEGKETIDFWKKIASYDGGSGISYVNVGSPNFVPLPFWIQKLIRGL